MASVPMPNVYRIPGIPKQEPERPKVREVADALRTPAPVTTSTPVNPLQQESYGMTKESYGASKDFAEGIAKGTNEEINRELGRARDEISVGIGKEGEAAMGRGADPSLFRSRAVERGARELGNLQGRLADVALNKRQAAINAQTGAAGSAANAAAATAAEQRSLHLGSAAQRLADQREVRERAESQARLDSAPFERMLALMNAAGNQASNLSGLSGAASPLTKPSGPSVPTSPLFKPGAPPLSGGGFGRVR